MLDMQSRIKMDKLRDNCHVTGRFRGATHNKCNINLRLPKKLPIIFHNLQGYDGHLIFKELNNFNADIEVIPKGIDKYISIIVNRHITFIIDSLQFYNGSRDTLASNLKDEDFKHLTSEFRIDKLEILKRKDAYLYEWVDSYEKFKHLSFPEKKYFYSSLKDGKRDKSNGHISDEQYQHLQNVWNIFNFDTFVDFHNHYSKKDVLLADVFEKFIFTCLKYYDLDPCHYFSVPGLSWDAMLKMTGVTLEKISDPDKYMFFEQGMRGGVSYINKRYSEASKNVNIPYLVMNNLYGRALSQYFPFANFKWVKDINKIEQKFMRIRNNSSTEYALEVDLEYPQELHNIHNDYPLIPEKINLPKEWLSDYYLKIANAHNITTGTVKKSVLNLMNKSNYVIHYSNLQQCLELGMKFKKIHRIFKFKQKDWMKPHTDFNTQKRSS